MSGGAAADPAARGPAYAHRGIAVAGILLLLAAIAVTAAARGARGRVVRSGRITVTVPSPALAYRVWKDAGVRGRVLVLFDRYPHLDLDYATYRLGTPPDDRDFLDFAIFENVVRKIYYVVPEGGWEDFERHRETYHPIRPVLGARRAMVVLVNDYSGISLVVATPSSLPALSEEVLVYVNPDVCDPREAASVLARAGLSADLTVVLRAEEGG